MQRFRSPEDFQEEIAVLVVEGNPDKPLEHEDNVLLADWLDRAGLDAERDDLRAEAARCRLAFNARLRRAGRAWPPRSFPGI